MEKQLDDIEDYVSKLNKILEDRDNLTQPDILNLMVYSQAIINKSYSILEALKIY